MNEEEKKTIEKFIEKCYKYDESVEIKGISVGEEYRMLNTVCKALNLIEKLQKENEELHREINRRIKLKIENEKIVDTQFIYKPKVKMENKYANTLLESIDNIKVGLKYYVERCLELENELKLYQEMYENRVNEYIKLLIL